LVSEQEIQDPAETLNPVSHAVHKEASREHSKQLVSEQEIQNPDETPNPVSHAVHIETLKEH
jgi:hypothetical protein